MPVQKTDKIWHNGKWILWDDAKLHVLTHAVGYGSAVFEGIRCYDTPQGPAIFRLREHMQRLINSGKIYRMEFAYSLDDFCNAACELVRLNKMGACYVKPIALRGYGEVGVNPLSSPIEIYMACWQWGAYLGPEALSKGVDVCVSSWTRIAPNTLPAMSKAAANYMNSQLIRMEAALNGFAEGIALDSNGHISEGSGMNLFLVHEGALITPPLSASILPGITRDSIVKIAADLNIPCEGIGDSAGDGLSGGRGVFCGDRGGGYADPVDRQDYDWKRSGGPGDAEDSGRVFRVDEREEGGPARVVDGGECAGGGGTVIAEN